MERADDEKLARYFDSLRREDSYRVDAVLKETPYEVTQRVSLMGADGEAKWPLIRKLIRRESGMGIAYERIFEAQQKGRRFKYIPRIQECYANEDCMVVVMEQVVGETLQDCVERRGASLPLACDVFPRLCDAVKELHECFDPPIIHRDLTPANVILSSDGLAIIDFGIAREYRDGAWVDTTRFGTRSFAPPEQYGFGQTSVRSDVFALGTMLYYCLTGCVPDVRATDEDLSDERIPAAMRPVIARATEIDPANRFASVNELLVAFERAVGMPVSERDADEGGEPVERFSFAGKVWNGFLALLDAIIVFMCVGLFVSPDEAAAHYPTWVNALGYLLVIPLMTIVLNWTLIDKRRLARRFPVLRKYKFRHWLVLSVVTFLVLFTVFGACLTLS